MTVVNLRPFLRPFLDILFVGLNAPDQSNSNGHYFSGKQSRFFALLHDSGLLTQAVPKASADEIVFGSTSVNYGSKAFGVVELARDTVQTNSSKVRVTRAHGDALLRDILEFDPRFVCVIHSRVGNGLNAHAKIISPTDLWRMWSVASRQFHVLRHELVPERKRDPR